MDTIQWTYFKMWEYYTVNRYYTVDIFQDVGLPKQNSSTIKVIQPIETKMYLFAVDCMHIYKQHFKHRQPGGPSDYHRLPF